MAGRDDVRDWYLRQHTNSSTAAAAAKPEGSKSGEKKAKEVSSDRNYLKLSPVVLNGPLSSNLQLRRDSPNVGVDSVVQELLASNVKTANNIAGAIENRLLDRPYLLDKPARESMAGRQRESQGQGTASLQQEIRQALLDAPAPSGRVVRLGPDVRDRNCARQASSGSQGRGCVHVAAGLLTNHSVWKQPLLTAVASQKATADEAHY